MMWFLLKCMAFALSILFFIQNPGAISIQWLGWQLSTTLGVFMGGLLTLFFILWIFISGWGGIKSFFAHLSKSRSARRKKEGHQALEAAFTALELGEHEQALGLARKSISLLPPNSIPGIVLLKAGHDSNDRSAKKEGAEILRHFPAAAPITLYMAIQDSIQRQRWDKAHDIIAEAIRKYPEQTTFLKFCLWSEVHKKNWDDAQEMLTTLVDEKVYTKAHAKCVQSYILLHQAQDDSAPMDLKHRKVLLQKAYELNDADYSIAKAYASILGQQEMYTEARQVLEVSWKNMPRWETAEQYCEIDPGQSKMEQARQALALEKLTVNPVGKVVAITYLIRAKLWGEASEKLGQLQAPGFEAYKGILTLALQGKDEPHIEKIYSAFKQALESVQSLSTAGEGPSLDQLILRDSLQPASLAFSPSYVASKVL